MKTKIKLADIEITKLSTESIALLSKLTIHIRKLSNQSLRLTDPRLLEKVSYKAKRINDPEVNALYSRYKQALKTSVNNTINGISTMAA